MIFENNSTLLCIGDSITDCGRARPVGKGGGLGFGYVNLINALIQTYNPTANITVLNTGISGNTIRDMKARWQTDVIDLKLDYLSIMIGVNDVWRKFDNPDHPELAVPVDEYTSIYKELIDIAKDKVKKIILITPFLIEKDKNEPMMNLLLNYIAAVKEIAKENGFILVDMQEIFDKYLADGMNPKMIAEDRVHPSQTGSMIIAKTFLERCGFGISYPIPIQLGGIQIYGKNK